MERTQDRLLVERLQAGEPRAVQELADKYGPRILQLAMRHMRNREDAEEVTQDVLLKVHQKIGLFRGDAALSSWIYRITFNTAMSRLRSTRAARLASEERDRALARQESASELSVLMPREPADWSQMPDEELLRAQLMVAFDQAGRGSARDLSCAGRPPRYPGSLDGRGEQPPEAEGSDAEVTPASWTATAA
jgi:RNA polymerase sigma factor (sigma-70 family)